MKHTITKGAALNAAGTVLYTALVATFLFHAEDLFGSGPDKTVIIPIAMLLLFVVSAATTGSLILGRPILWYIDGKKQEAVSLLITTIGFLFLAMVIAFTILGFMG